MRLRVRFGFSFRFPFGVCVLVHAPALFLRLNKTCSFKCSWHITSAFLLYFLLLVSLSSINVYKIVLLTHKLLNIIEHACEEEKKRKKLMRVDSAQF